MSGSTGVEPKAQGPVYLDYAATTPVAPEVAEAMSGCLGQEGVFGNPASHSHRFGREAREAVDDARAKVADLIHASPEEIVWTSGATESINLAIKGVARGGTARGRHIVTSSMEHKAVLDTCAQLRREGHEITCVEPDSSGQILPERIEEVLRGDTALVSLMHVNNEVGTITRIGAIGELTHARGIVFHVDAAQSAVRLPLDVRDFRADLVSLSGHKMYGPKGVGVLFVRRSCPVRLEAQIHGGDQENGLRSGTLATHQVVGMGRAAQLVSERRRRDVERTVALDRRLRRRLGSVPQTFLNGNQHLRVPGILNVEFAGADSEALMMAVRDDVAISSGSACTSSRLEPSHVLEALGLSIESAQCSVRFSLGRYTTEAEVDRAARRIAEAVGELRKLSAGWTSLGNGKAHYVHDGERVRRARVPHLASA